MSIVDELEDYMKFHRRSKSRSVKTPVIYHGRFSFETSLVETTIGQDMIYLPGLAQYDGTNWQYFAADRLGSVRQLVDPTGALVLGQTFDPFGNVLAQTGAGQSLFGYTGQQTDPAGLVFLRARYYDPGVGRFLTADSVVPDPLRSGGWNQYTYVENNPIVYVDPSGHQGGCAMLPERPIAPMRCIPEGGGPSPGGGFGGTSHIRVGIEAVGVAAAALANRFNPFPLESPDENPQHVTVPDNVQQCFGSNYHPFPMDQIEFPFYNLPGRPIDVPWWGGSPPGFSLAEPGSLVDNILYSVTRWGIKRRNLNYFKRLVKQYRDILGEASKNELKARRMPYVDQNWIKYFPEHEPYLGEKLTVHHVSAWIEKPIPQSLHPDHHAPGGYRNNPGNP